jgi:hypothetical protein
MRTVRRGLRALPEPLQANVAACLDVFHRILEPQLLGETVALLDEAIADLYNCPGSCCTRNWSGLLRDAVPRLWCGRLALRLARRVPGRRDARLLPAGARRPIRTTKPRVQRAVISSPAGVYRRAGEVRDVPGIGM